MTRKVCVAGAYVLVLAGLGLAASALDRHALGAAGAAVQAPRFEVDPLWPKPLPNKWILGQTIGVSVDALRWMIQTWSCSSTQTPIVAPSSQWLGSGFGHSGSTSKTGACTVSPGAVD